MKMSFCRCDNDFLTDDVGFHQSPDALLAYELNQLSLKEREEINQEVHGVRDQYHQVEECPELIEESLEKLSRELDKIRYKPAYNRSQMFSNSWVNTRRFRLMFLRCELFDIKKAAIRMAALLELLLEYVGEFALEREMYISDLNKQDRWFLDEGYLQVLPLRDRSVCGRRILGHFSGDMVTDNPNQNYPCDLYIQSRIKVTIYTVIRMVMGDVDIQRSGIVFLFWMHAFRIDDFRARSYVHKRILPAIPVRINAMHCYVPLEGNKRLLELGKQMYLLSIGSELRSRLRIHTGSTTECLYIVETYGISSSQIPIDPKTGQRKTENHEKWIRQQIEKESYYKCQRTFNGIECPRHTDVLFGRGSRMTKHPGNTLYRHVLGQHFDSYNTAASKAMKRKIAVSIILELRQSYGSRFLREGGDKDTSHWHEVPDELARDKIAVGFRDMRKRMGKKKPQCIGETKGI